MTDDARDAARLRRRLEPELLGRYLREFGDSGFVSVGEKADGSVSYTLGNGQVDDYPRSWCIPLEKCYQALAFFFVNDGMRPEWLQWQED